MIYENLLNKSAKFMENLTVKDVCIGLGYTAVENSSGGLGLAFTFRNMLPHRCSVFKDAGKLKGRSLKEVSKMFLDDNLLHSAIGLAAINSAAKPALADMHEGDVLEVASVKKNEHVLMIGHFAPLEFQIRQITSNVIIIDNKFSLEDSDRASTEKQMENCTTVLITATTLINKTLEEIIKKTPRAETRVLLGPSTPLYREAFEGTGIQVLSGMQVRNPEKVKEIVCQAGGTMHFKEYSRKVNIFIKEQLS